MTVPMGEQRQRWNMSVTSHSLPMIVYKGWGVLGILLPLLGVGLMCRIASLFNPSNAVKTNIDCKIFPLYLVSQLFLTPVIFFDNFTVITSD